MTAASAQLAEAALSGPRTLFEAALIIVLAALAPLVAQVLRIPSILLLLAFGFGAGAVGALDPDALLGEELISAIVSISVGVILFDSGLDLRFSDLRGATAHTYRRLVTLGILVTFVVAAVASHLLVDLSWSVALVLGAVLVVSGPTVVGPLLNFVRPTRTVRTVLTWEGTLADPIGATLGVLVFQAVLAGQTSSGRVVLEFLTTVGVGAGLGVLGALAAIGWARWFQPSQSQAVTGTLMIVVASVVAADLLRDDSGLITGLAMGALLVNRAPRGLQPLGLRVQSAKLARAWRARVGTLATFLIGVLFIVLSARVSPADIGDLGWTSVALVAVLIFLARPLAVLVCTFGSTLSLPERAFLAWMAPRGIVAAATLSTFSLGLVAAGIGGGAEKLLPLAFVVIIGTAVVYGLSGLPVARLLGVSSSGPEGVLLVGGSRLSRAIAGALRDHEVTVVVWTTDEDELAQAEADNLVTYRGDPTAAEPAGQPTELDTVGSALVVSEQASTMAILAADLAEAFGSHRVYQLPVEDGDHADFYVRAQLLFDERATFRDLSTRLAQGARVMGVEARRDGSADLGSGAIAMFVLTPGRRLSVITAGDQPHLDPGDVLIGISRP